MGSLLHKTVLMAMAAWLITGTALAGQNLIFIVDGSASMASPLEKNSKIQAVREALINVFKTLPDDVDVGLMAFGARQRGDCEDVAILLPAGRHSVQTFAKKLATVAPTGMTPLAASLLSLKAMAKKFQDPTTAVIIADGQETCLGNPCEDVRQIKQLFRDMVIHVIGLNVPLSEKTSLVCVSGNTGGRYHSVSDSSALKNALVQAAKTDMAIPSPGKAPAIISPPASQMDESGSPPAKPVRKIQVRVWKGRVREGPSFSSKILFGVDQGDMMFVLGVRGDWNQVMDGQGRSGWAHYSLFAPHLKPAVKKPKPIARIEDICVKVEDVETRVIFSLSQPVRPKILFTSKNGPAVVCVFPGVWPGFDDLEHLPEGPAGHIQTIAVDGGRGDGFQVNLTLDPAQSYELKHYFIGDDRTYLLVVRPVPASAEGGN